MNKDTTNRQMNGTLWCIAGLLISFLAHNCHASNCHCSSIKAADPVSPALSSSQYAKDNLSSLRAVLFAYKDSLAAKEKKNLALKCAVNYCLLLQEIHICPSIRNVSRLHHRQQMGVHHGVMYLQHSARYLAGRVCSRWFFACSGRRNRFEHTVLSAAFICTVSASAGPLPGSRRRKDSNALSSPYF